MKKSILIIIYLILSININAQTDTDTLEYSNKFILKNLIESSQNNIQTLEINKNTNDSNNIVYDSIYENTNEFKILVDKQISNLYNISTYYDKSDVKKLNGFDMTNILVGITDFAIERSKMELNIFFFNRFEVFLNKNPEAKTLFPNTLQILNRIKSFQFNEFLPSLRKAFFEDLKKFPDHTLTVLTLPKYQKLLSEFPEIKIAIKSLISISKLKYAKKNEQLFNIITEIASFPEYYDENGTTFLKNYGACWKVINNVSLAFINPETNIYYNKETIDAIINDPIRLNYLFLILIYNIKNDNIKFYNIDGDSLDLYIKLNSIDVNIIFKSFVENVAMALNDFEIAKFKAITNLNYSIDKDKRKQVAIEYLEASNNTIDAISNIFSLIDVISAEPYINNIRSVSKITTDAINQDYPSLASSSIGFLQSVFEMANNKTKSEKVNKILKVFDKLSKYSNFAANIIEAKSSKEIKDVIETTVLPPGSSSIKKHSTFNISLQLHLGISFTCKNYDKDKAAIPSWKNKVNITLPIGISFNTGFGKGGSLGIFASLVDIGALAQFRISESDTTTLKERIRFQNIFSPGFYLSYGFPFNWPISLNFGGQFGPGLTKATRNDIIIEKPTWRLQTSITIDIPAYTLFNISKNGQTSKNKNGQVDSKKYDFSLNQSKKKKI